MARRQPPATPTPRVLTPLTRGGRATSRGLTAAARRIKLNDRKQIRAAASRVEWQRDAWTYFDEIPEVKFGVEFTGDAFSKLRLIPAAIPVNGGPMATPVPIDHPDAGIPPALAQSAALEIARLNNSASGIGGLLRRLVENLEVAGECHLVGFAARPAPTAGPGEQKQDDQPEEWAIASTAELAETNGRLTLRADEADRKGRPLDPETDTAFRIWHQHAQWADRADSHVRGVLATCKTLTYLTRQIDAEALSRLSAGILVVPNGLEGRPPPDAADDSAEGENAEEGDSFLDELEEALVTPIEEPGSAASVVPMLVRGDKEDAAQLRHVQINRQSDQYLDGRIDKQVNRLARGLHVPVEVVLGHMSTTYANAEQVDVDTWEDYLEPRAVTVCEAFTVGFLRPNLTESAAGTPQDVARVCVWFDASALIPSPDQAEHANEAHERLTVSDKAYRKAIGFDEGDAPDEVEVARRMGSGVGDAPGPVEVAEALQKIYLAVGPVITSEEARRLINSMAPGFLDPGTPEGVGPAPEAPPPVLGSSVVHRENPGTRLAAIDRELRSMLLAASNAAMNRALERAGNRLRNRANGQRAVLARVPVDEVAVTLGPSTVAALVAAGDDVFGDAWDELERQYRAWGSLAQRDALDVAGQVAGGFNLAQRAELQLRQAENLDEGWAWMLDRLTSLAHERLFDPHPAAPALGEHDPSLRVPPGLIRNAVSIAGGAPLQTTDGSAAFVTVGVVGDNVGGIGTGALLSGAMTDAGAGIEAYRWTYGPALRHRPFEPHVRLDGKVFRHFDDPVLANSHGFPSVAFFIPGDHPGCVCDATPIIIPASEAAARGLVLKVDGEFDPLTGLTAGVVAERPAVRDDAPMTDTAPDPETSTVPPVQPAPTAPADEPEAPEAE